MAMGKHRILYDLTLGHSTMGYSGIPQDTRLLFSGLLRSSVLDVCGLVRPCGQTCFAREDLGDVLGQSVLLGHCLGVGSRDADSVMEKLIGRFGHPKLARGYSLYLRSSRGHDKIYRVMTEKFYEMLWRSFFSPTLSPGEFERLRGATYFLCRTGGDKVRAATLMGTQPPRLDTKGIQFFLTQDCAPFAVRPETQKLVRYHDGIPLLHSDTFESRVSAKLHFEGLKRSANDNIFVCNSPSAMADLGNICEAAAVRARVIPYFLPPMKAVRGGTRALKSIAASRIARLTMGSSYNLERLDDWFRVGTSAGDIDGIPQYILSVATIEPRKNYVSLIKAWQKLRYDSEQDVRLIIVGSPGWKYEPTIDVMRKYAAMGELLHLEKVDQRELPYLYSYARCFVFPSVAEGFGLPPCEAMQCGCPVALSDIPAHRYAAGEAAVFFDPYDIDDMARAIGSLLFANQDSGFIQDLTAEGYKNSKRFSVEEILPLWEDLFEELSRKRDTNLRAAGSK